MSETAEATRYALVQAKPEQVGPLARHIMPLVQKACDHSGGRFDPNSVFENCAGLNKRQTWYLWLVLDADKSSDAKLADRVKAIAVTALVDYPTGLRLGETILIGGHGPSDEWLNYIDGLKDWAKANGAHRMQYIGRRGWQRHMKSVGIEWKPVMTMYEYEIGGDADGVE